MGTWFAVGGAVVLVLIVVYVIATYNRLVGLRNQVRNGWSQIDVQLKRRHDLIPNLVNAVKGAMAHERELIERVTEARAQAIAAGADVPRRAEAESALTQAVSRLFAIAEAYPELKANQNMLALQEELASTENKVAFARQFYNDAVMRYNTAQEVFPAVIFASALGFRPSDRFLLEDATERAVPQVTF